MQEADFFSAIEPFDNFEDVFTPARYRALPADWLIAVCDIQGSTASIADGKYKEINLVGASAIVAVLNAVDRSEIPYVFGGDGASFAIPPAAAVPVASALRGTQNMAREAFGLNLLAGLVPVADVRAAGHDVRVARYRLSEKVAIAMFEGGGLTAAEQMLKDPHRSAACDIARWASSEAPADFSGLECRWNPLKAARGHIVTLIARATANTGPTQYRELFRTIEEICGAQSGYRPMRKGALTLALAPKRLKSEHTLQSHGRSNADRLLYAFKIAVESMVGTLIFKTGVKVGALDGKTYVDDVLRNADFQKFDDALRMVMDNTPDQTERLTAYLEDQFKGGKIFFGTHIEQEAMVTCLIFDRANRHVHFVDGARGGYAAAAQAMKARMAAVAG